jgi:hypothetical protein
MRLHVNGVVFSVGAAALATSGWVLPLTAGQQVAYQIMGLWRPYTEVELRHKLN